QFIPRLNPQQYPPTNFVRDFDRQMRRIIENMIQSAPAVNNWIIPLSGGHDSRMLVNYLYKAQIKNVICFSYGSANNLQSRISKKVAEAVEYDWHFVEYTEEKWGELHNKGIFDAYIDYAF